MNTTPWSDEQQAGSFHAVLGSLRGWIENFRPPPIVDATALGRFLSGESSYLAQRATYEFARNTLAYFGQWAFNDDKFNDAFRISRWEAFAAILADAIMLTEGRLRPAASNPESLLAPLVALYHRELNAYPLPAHRSGGWDDLVERLRARLTVARLAAPIPAGELAKVAARRVYDTLPLYSDNKEYDVTIIDNAVRFGFVAFSDRLVARLRPSAVAADLTGTGQG